MSNINKRLLIQLEQNMRKINKETLNPLFEEIDTSGVLPIMEMVAEARGNYLKEFVRISKIPKDEREINPELLKKLRFTRIVYDELVDAYKALDTAIERGYLDVEFK